MEDDYCRWHCGPEKVILGLSCEEISAYEKLAAA